MRIRIGSLTLVALHRSYVIGFGGTALVFGVSCLYVIARELLSDGDTDTIGVAIAGGLLVGSGSMWFAFRAVGLMSRRGVRPGWWSEHGWVPWSRVRGFRVKDGDVQAVLDNGFGLLLGRSTEWIWTPVDRHRARIVRRLEKAAERYEFQADTSLLTGWSEDAPELDEPRRRRGRRPRSTRTRQDSPGVS